MNVIFQQIGQPRRNGQVSKTHSLQSLVKKKGIIEHTNS